MLVNVSLAEGLRIAGYRDTTEKKGYWTQFTSNGEEGSLLLFLPSIKGKGISKFHTVQCCWPAIEFESERIF